MCVGGGGCTGGGFRMMQSQKRIRNPVFFVYPLVLSFIR